MSQTHSTPATAPDRAAIGAAIALFTAGGLFWAFLPFFIGLQEDRGGLSATQAGALGSAYLAGFTIAGLAAPWWSARMSPRGVIAAGVLLVWLGLASLARGIGYPLALAACSGIGLALGAFWVVAYRVFGATPNAERVFALAIAIGYPMLAAITFVIGHLVLPQGGLFGMTTAIALLIGLLAAAAVKLPARLDNTAATTHTGTGDEKRLPLACGLAAIALFSLAFAAVWAFAERIGTQAGFGGPTVASVLSSNLLFTGLGSVGIALFGKHFGRWQVLVASYVLLAVCMAALGHAGTIAWFAFVIAGLGFGVGTGLPHQMAIVSQCDVRGRFVALIAAMQGLGTALGPLVGGAAFQVSGTTALGIVGAVALAASFVLLLVADR
ncbi:MFS transporter [Rhodanobacter sp. B2A1Ga4]|uniref:MFS transporter n=1 Tax=Rhodanobacter TaxID=75309 RepID=UPI000D3DB77E|nr:MULTISPECIES: MFS transporter [Rhodanobacter]MBQ4856374.1 MFS transporter [Rhodanobacter sp. B2A1Ga4]